MTACDATTGPEAWSTTLPHRFVDPYPGVTAGRFICFNYDNEDYPRDDDHRKGPGIFMALDLATGRIVWQQPADLDRFILIGENMVFYRGADDAIHALDAATGRQRWLAPHAGDLIAVGQGTLVMSDAEYHTELRDAATGTVRFRRDRGYHDATGMIGKDVLYLADDGVTGIQLSTGKELWYNRRPLQLKRISHGMLLGQLTYASTMVALRAEDGAEIWTSDGHIAGASKEILAIERMEVGPVYRIHKVDIRTGREIGVTPQEQFKTEYDFQNHLTLRGVAFAVPYVDHYSYLSQRLRAYSREAISKDEWIEAHEPGGSQVFWKTTRLWGWVTDLIPAETLVIRGETPFKGGNVRIRALRAQRNP